jgi:hypothetical protein
MGDEDHPCLVHSCKCSCGPKVQVQRMLRWRRLGHDKDARRGRGMPVVCMCGCVELWPQLWQADEGNRHSWCCGRYDKCYAAQMQALPLRQDDDDDVPLRDMDMSGQGPRRSHSQSRSSSSRDPTMNKHACIAPRSVVWVDAAVKLRPPFGSAAMSQP